MVHTENIEKAIHKASLLHRTQVRKGGDELPYITHLFSVFLILSEHTKDEDTLIASLLHDTLEDTDYTAEALEADFGAKVRSIVEGVTLVQEHNGEKVAWEDQRRLYVSRLKEAPIESVMVSCADKTHNFRTILNQYKGNGAGFKKDFSQADRVKFYGAIVEVISERLGDVPLTQNLNNTFNEYQTFLEDTHKDKVE